MLTIRFLFSSSRRHTRSKRDWSSDVCSFDLGGYRVNYLKEGQARISVVCAEGGNISDSFNLTFKENVPTSFIISDSSAISDSEKIGRASCREREWSWVWYVVRRVKV